MWNIILCIVVLLVFFLAFTVMRLLLHSLQYLIPLALAVAVGVFVSSQSSQSLHQLLQQHENVAWFLNNSIVNQTLSTIQSLYTRYVPVMHSTNEELPPRLDDICGWYSQELMLSHAISTATGSLSTLDKWSGTDMRVFSDFTQFWKAHRSTFDAYFKQSQMSSIQRVACSSEQVVLFHWQSWCAVVRLVAGVNGGDTLTKNVLKYVT